MVRVNLLERKRDNERERKRAKERERENEGVCLCVYVFRYPSTRNFGSFGCVNEISCVKLEEAS